MTSKYTAVGNRSLWWLPLLLCFLLPATVLVLINFNYSNPAFAADDQLHLLPTFNSFAAHWGHFDFKNYYSPAAPGYFIFIGTVQRWITADIVGLRIFNLLLSAGFVFTFAAITGSYCAAPLSVFLAAPLILSDTVFTRAIWLNTDNPAWWCVVGIFAIALNPRLSAWRFALAGMLAFILVGTRQIHIWTIPLLITAAACSLLPVRNAIRMSLAVGPALLLVAWLATLWGGLVPPAFQTRRPGVSFAALPMTFSLFALFGSFYATALWPAAHKAFTKSRSRTTRFLIAGFSAGLLAALAPDATYLPYYRASGIWQLARRHLFHGHSPVIVVLCLTGGLVIGALLSLLDSRDRWIFGGAILFFVTVHCSNRAVFERYYEPFVLIVLTFATARIVSRSPEVNPDKWKMAAGPALLTVLQAGYTIIQFSTPR